MNVCVCDPAENHQLTAVGPGSAGSLKVVLNDLILSFCAPEVLVLN